MSGSRDPDATDPVRVEAAIADDKRSALLTFRSGTSTLLVAAADTTSVEALISSLGALRHQMLDPVPADWPGGVLPIAAFNPRWYVWPDTQNKFATFWIRHPGLGWSGFGFPRSEAASIAKWLRKIPEFRTTRETQSSAATSFGGDKFLITTEGLGFYYYGQGETRIGPNPFEQIEFDSDRAAGIVAGSVVDQRLEEAIRSKLKSDQPNVLKKLFRPSGPLGAFGTKIDLAYLQGLLSDVAYKDLTSIKDIRNEFAHELEVSSFDASSISSRCASFTLVDRHVGPIPETFGGSKHLYYGLPDYKDKLADPRFRYTMTAQILSYVLGESADKKDAPVPFI